MLRNLGQAGKVDCNITNFISENCWALRTDVGAGGGGEGLLPGRELRSPSGAHPALSVEEFDPFQVAALLGS